MIKRNCFFISLVFLISCAGVTPSSEKKSVAQNKTGVSEINFRVEVHQSGMTFDDNYIFSNDSVFLRATNIAQSIHDSVIINRKPTPLEKNMMMEILSAIDLDAIQPGKARSDMDDAIEFTFFIRKGNQAKKWDIYLQSEKNLFLLTEKLNTMLPENFLINYNAHYVENGY